MPSMNELMAEGGKSVGDGDARRVLALRWRPQIFEEMIGQEVVVRALGNALRRGQLHHAYLFTGTRGVGKTTVARILARCLNCEQGVSAEPCGRCASCEEIRQGRFIDLVEVDAASRTKVEDTRELLENVQYAPVRGRFKIYLIDEVHMLSGHSFNALLKTLEEPPPHVKFLLATTDPQKLPATVLSRCLQFHLRHVPAREIADYLAAQLKEEGVEAESAALELLAVAANGSVRDAISLTDQGIAYGGGGLDEKSMRSMLGAVEFGRALDLLEKLCDEDNAAMVEELRQLSQWCSDYEALLGELLSALYRVAVAQSVPGVEEESGLEGGRIKALARRMAPETVQIFYQIGVVGRRDFAHAPTPRIAAEMCLLRMLSFQKIDPRTDSVVDADRGAPPDSAPPDSAPPDSAPPDSAPPDAPPSAAPKPPDAAPASLDPASAGVASAAVEELEVDEEASEPREPLIAAEKWPDFCAEMDQKNALVKLLGDSVLESCDGVWLKLMFVRGDAPLNGNALPDELCGKLQRLLAERLGEPNLRVQTRCGELPEGVRTPRMDERIRGEEAWNDDLAALREDAGFRLLNDSIPDLQLLRWAGREIREDERKAAAAG